MTPYTEVYIQNLADDKFYALLGVHKPQFNDLIGIMQRHRDAGHKKGGRPFKMTAFDSVVIMMLYLKRYFTMFAISTMYGISKSSVNRTYNSTLDTIIRSGNCRLEGLRTAGPGDLVLINATECEVNRPKRGQKSKYSGKKTAHV